jgi:hypothetical protein
MNKINPKKAFLISALIIVGGLAVYGLLSPDQIRLPDAVTTSTQAPAPTSAAQQIIAANPQRDYEIAYEPLENLYIISILKSDFEGIRKIAEQDLLTKLNLTQDTACDTKVIISAPFYASPDKQQVYNKFSFCP